MNAMESPKDLTVSEFRDIVANIEAEIAKTIIGQKDVVRFVLIGVLSGGHVLLEGVPGLGKTMLIRALGQVVDLTFSRIQFTPDLMPADITGTEIMEEMPGGQRTFRFRPGPIFANLVLADEINRATPKTQSALLEAMQEATITVANDTHHLPSPFFVMATQNPLEMEGTYPLPEAQLDRFILKIDVPYPSAGELTEILERTSGQNDLFSSPITNGTQILAMQKLARQVPTPSRVGDYVSRIIIASHPGESPSNIVNQYVRYGASPRGGQAMILGARIMALLDGRYNVSFEDVAAMAPAALRHRLLLNFEGQAEGIKTDAIIEDLITEVSIDVA